jgi:WD40 repeat protein
VRRSSPAALSLAIALLLIFPGASATPGGDRFDPQLLDGMWSYDHGAENGTLWSVCWSPDDTRVAAAFFNNDVVVLNATSGAVVKVLSAQPEETRCDGYAPPGHLPTRAVAWSPDGGLLAAGGDDHVISVWGTGTWDLYRRLSRHRGGVQSLAWSNSGDFLASGSGRDKVLPSGIGENQTFIWDVANATVVARLEGHRDSVLGIAWSPDDGRIATASDDRTARIWDASTGEELAVLEGHTSGVLDCSWSPDGTRLVTGSRDYKARLWDAVEYLDLGRWSDNNCVRSVDWHPDGAHIATSGVDKTLKVRNATTGSVLVTLDDGIDLDSIPMKSRWDSTGTFLVAGYGKAGVVVMYGPVGSGPGEDGADARAILSLTSILVLSAASVGLILIPAVRRARRRRG